MRTDSSTSHAGRVVPVAAIAFAMALACMLADARAASLFVSYTHPGANRIQRFSTDAGGGSAAFASTTANPYGLAFDAAGNLYAAQVDNTIHKFSPVGVDLGVFAVTGINSIPTDLAFDTAGRLYVALEGLHTVRRFSATGANLGTFGSTGLVSPNGLAFDSAGNLYVSSSSNSTVRRYSPTGAELGEFASGAVLDTPFDLAFDAAGNLLVANASFSGTARTIHKFGATGADLGVFATNLFGFSSLAINDNGDVFASFSEGRNQIHRYSSEGMHLGIFATTANVSSPGFLTFQPRVPEPAGIGLAVAALGIVVRRRRGN